MESKGEGEGRVVWCVMQHVEHEGSFLESVWSTAKLASAETSRLRDKYAECSGRFYDYEEWPVDPASDEEVLF